MKLKKKIIREKNEQLRLCFIISAALYVIRVKKMLRPMRRLLYLYVPKIALLALSEKKNKYLFYLIR